jgi:hypothetical protein
VRRRQRVVLLLPPIGLMRGNLSAGFFSNFSSIFNFIKIRIKFVKINFKFLIPT